MDDWRDNLDPEWLYLALGRWCVWHYQDEKVLAKDIFHRIECAVADWEYYISEDGGCGSPIEAIFFANALFATDGYNEASWETFPGQNPPPDFGTRFRVQEKLGRHRVDFLFTCYCRGKTRRLAVECDGHDFHERTKQQAAHDRSRDREITLSGTTVVRFTGSELFKDPIKCIEEVNSQLVVLMEEAMVEAGVMQPRKRT